MSVYPGSVPDVYVKYRIDDLLREAERDRLADSVARPQRRGVRVLLADTLRAAAQRLDSSPQLASA